VPALAVDPTITTELFPLFKSGTKGHCCALDSNPWDRAFRQLSWILINSTTLGMPGMRLRCFWAARESGLSHTALAKKLEMSVASVRFSVERGEKIAKDGKYSLEG
jgi:hypothetical protein